MPKITVNGKAPCGHDGYRCLVLDEEGDEIRFVEEADTDAGTLVRIKYRTTWKDGRSPERETVQAQFKVMCGLCGASWMTK